MGYWKDYLPPSSQVLTLARSTREEGERGPGVKGRAVNVGLRPTPKPRWNLRASGKRTSEGVSLQVSKRLFKWFPVTNTS